jgi:CheY-like chemotaxis protein
MRYDGKTRGVWYFDFSQVAAAPDFDLAGYQQKYLAPDFYQNEGSIQWNYYLYFILEQSNFTAVEASGFGKKIELERTFARKFVRNEASFIKEYSENLNTTLFTGEKPKDIASYWVEELNNAGLGQIADVSIPYTKIVDDYLKARATTSVLPQQPKNGSSVPNGRFLNELEIKSFRKHPLKRSFNFGQVNLIRGVNGSGKTSLLEAIELGICGGIKRQSGKSPAKAALMLTFNGDAELTKAPLSDPTHYRNIDAAFAMPGMKGDALAVAIKQRLPNQPILMISANGALSQSAGFPLTGVDFVISKPFLLEDPRTAIARVLPVI